MTDRPDPRAAMARLEELRRQAEATLSRYRELQDELGSQAVEAHSEDGLVSVRLDAEGKVAQIRIDEYAMRRRQTLGATIVGLVREAQGVHAEQSAGLAMRFLGADPDLAGLLDRFRPDGPR